MFSYFSSFFRTEQHCPDIKFVRKIHSMIGRKAYIGGSYALKEYLKDYGLIEHIQKRIVPSDIDIFIKVSTIMDFESISSNFLSKLGPNGNVTDYYNVRQEKKSYDGDRGREKFHQNIVATLSVDIITNIEEITTKDLNVIKFQLIGIIGPDSSSLEDILFPMIDIPACVLMSFNEFHHTYYVSSTGSQILSTGVGSILHICPYRKEKYENRGFKFI